MENFSVEYYETEDGTRPAEEFILSQDKKMQAKLFMSLELLEIKGPGLREPSVVLLCCGAKSYFDEWLCQENSQNPARRNS